MKSRRRAGRDVGTAVVCLLLGVAGVTVLMARPEAAVPLGLAALVGMAGLVVAVLRLLKAGVISALGNAVVVRMVTRELWRAPWWCERITVVLPVAQLTEGFTELLCTLPGSAELEICATGLWPSYQKEAWRRLLEEMEERTEAHFESVTFTGSVWQSPLLTVEVDGEMGVLVPLERSGSFGLFVELGLAPEIAPAVRQMHESILEHAVPLEKLTEPLEVER